MRSDPLLRCGTFLVMSRPETRAAAARLSGSRFASMQITEIKIFPVNGKKFKAGVKIVIDNSFAISDIKIIPGTKGYLVQMPQRKQPDGTYIDLAAPINHETRDMIENKIFEAYQPFADEPVRRRVAK